LKRDKVKKAAVFSVADYPWLREFFSAYLHEDFQDEYGSAASAARAFCSDANVEEVKQTREEWVKLRKSLANRAIPELQEALRRLGGAWRPQGEDELRDVDAAFAEKG
jgi:hypothetical protein